VTFRIDAATSEDVPVLFDLVKQLAEYEKLSSMVSADAAMLHAALFGARPVCEAVLARAGGSTVGFALFFFTFSTFLGRPGLYLEDLFVIPEQRGKGYGKALLRHLARLAAARECGRFEWRVLDWNEPSIRFYESLGGSIMKEWLLVRMTGDSIAALANQQE
jgi:GNAT superfamily N-acetyltransferase